MSTKCFVSVMVDLNGYKTTFNSKGHRKRLNTKTGDVESAYKPLPLYSETDTYKDRLRLAYHEWQMRQGRMRKPDGIWINDGIKKQWWPTPIETRPCCREVAQPGPKWGFALLQHCSSLVHVANLFDVSETHLRSAHYFIRKHVRNNGELSKVESVRHIPINLKVDKQILEFALSAALGKNPL